MRFMLVATEASIVYRASGPRGAADLSGPLFKPVVKALASDGYVPKTVGYLATLLPDITLAQLIHTMKILTATGEVSPAQDDHEAQAAKARTDALNRQLIARAVLGRDPVSFLASPVTASGIPFSRLEVLFMSAILQGMTSPAEWAYASATVLNSQGEVLAVGQRVLSSADDLAAGLGELALDFAKNRLDLLRALMVI